MAQQQISLGINLRQNKNSENEAAFGKYYPEVDLQKTLSLRGFAQHMTEHGSFYNRAIVEGVLKQIVACLPELLSQGVPVKLDGLGTFFPSAEVQENAGVETILDMAGLNPEELVKAIHIRFLPDRNKLDNITGPAFKGKCSMELRNIVDTIELTVNGKSKKFQTLKPIATAVAEAKGYNGTPSDDSGSTTGGNTSTGSGTNTGGNTTGGNTGGGNTDPDSGDGGE